MAAAGRWRAGLALLAVALGLGGTRAEQTEEHLKREHSLSKPYQEQAGSRVEPSALLPARLGDAGALQDPRAGQEEPERRRLRHLVHQGQDAARPRVRQQGQLPGAGRVRGHLPQRGETARAGVPLHLGHGEQRLADLRPRPRRAPHRAGRLHGHGAQPRPRHLPGHPLRQEEAHGADRHRRQARVAGLHRRAGRAPAPRVLLRELLPHRGPLRQPRHHLAEAVPADGGALGRGGAARPRGVPARGGQPAPAGHAGPAGAHERPGPVPHRLLLARRPRLRHRHRHHPLQQMAGAEPQALLLTPGEPPNPPKPPQNPPKSPRRAPAPADRSGGVTPTSGPAPAAAALGSAQPP